MLAADDAAQITVATSRRRQASRRHATGVSNAAGTIIEGLWIESWGDAQQAAGNVDAARQSFQTAAMIGPHHQSRAACKGRWLNLWSSTRLLPTRHHPGGTMKKRHRSNPFKCTDHSDPKTSSPSHQAVFEQWLPGTMPASCSCG
jgi:hypothetical protein